MNKKIIFLLLSLSCGIFSLTAQNVSFTYSKASCITGKQITFISKVPKEKSEKNIIWNFGDDCGKYPFYRRSDCDIYVKGTSKVTHVYQQPGLYRVSMRIEGSDEDIYSEIIRIEPSLNMLKSKQDSAGNYIRNPGFEIYSECPTNIGQITRAQSWYSPSPATSDYFNSCFILPDVYNWSVDVPENFAGNTVAYKGHAYAGIATFLTENSTFVKVIDTIIHDTIINDTIIHDTIPIDTVIVDSIFPDPFSPYFNYREYIQTELPDTLIKGKSYVISIRAHLAPNSRIVTGLGAYISRTPPQSTEPAVFSISPQFIIKPDTAHRWIHLKDTFTAAGGEKFLTIGNFLDDFQTPLIDAFPGKRIVSHYGGFSVIASYYYIDQVEIIPLGWSYLDRMAIVSAGHSYKDESLMVDYSIGQRISATFMNSAANACVTQGILQPDEINNQKKMQNSQDFSVDYFPNPTKDYVTLNIISTNKSPFYYFKLSDMWGKVCKYEKRNVVSDAVSNEVIYSLKGFETGIYILQVTDCFNQSVHLKIIVINN